VLLIHCATIYKGIWSCQNEKSVLLIRATNKDTPTWIEAIVVMISVYHILRDELCWITNAAALSVSFVARLGPAL
jgi:hypothetical protein